MTPHAHNAPTPGPQSSPLAGLDDPTFLLAGLALVPILLGVRAGWRAHPVLVVAGALALIALAGLGLLLVARVRDRHARRSDPPGPGVILGTVRGSWVLAGRRAFELPWSSLLSHVLVAGPTGQGKSHTVIRPLLHALAVRARHAPTGVFYLDGKGDRVDRAVPFDAVFCPEDPERSARWNPLAGPDPVEAARAFAAALFPAAALPGASFYEQKAVWVITRVAPAMALTGHGLSAAAGPRPQPAEEAEATPAELLARLVSAGVSQERAGPLVRTSARRVRALLASGRVGADLTGDALVGAITADASPPPPPPGRSEAAAAAQPGHVVTPAELNRMVFDPDLLAGLVEALEDERSRAPTSAGRALLEQLSTDVRALTTLGARERNEVLQTLGQGLGRFLSPPFLELCSRSDFSVADVCLGRRMAFLLPVGRFGTEAAPLGRVALAQFTQAVLASPEDDPTWKIALLDEFAQFVSGDFAAFLAMARSRSGGAVCAVQSLGQLPPEARAAMLDNLRTRIVLAGSGPEDARYWSEAFGQEERERVSRSYPAGRSLRRHELAQERVEVRAEPRFDPTRVAELEPGEALIQLQVGRTAYPATRVSVEHRG